MTDVALVTYSGAPGVATDDQLVADVLGAQGLSVAAACWDDPRIVWSGFGCAVIRSTWDYHQNVEAYHKWLRRCEASGANLWNPPSAVRSNLSKRYLLELEQRGVPIIPTRVLGPAVRLRDVLDECGWNDAVVKPAVSIGGQGAWRTSRATAEGDQRQLDRQMRAQQMLVQPYLNEVATEGEWSLVFFGGEFSHAVIKRPADGEFRVHQHLGGFTDVASPTPGVIDQARAVLSTFGSTLLYARVDGVVRGGRLLLMELEINEPCLFLEYSAEAPGRFAAAIVERLRRAGKEQAD